MIEYAVKIDSKYFKEYVYAGKTTKGRHSGHTQFGSFIQEGDIIDIITTIEPERTETKRSIGNTIALLYEIENIKNKVIQIIPINC
jgi:hypothetical protein